MDPASAFSFDDSYCGPPPDAASLLGRWNLDPLLLVVLALGGVALFWRLWHAGAWHRGGFIAGWLCLVILFVSPLCALTVALLSGRVTHHVLLTMVAAPLLALAIGRSVVPSGRSLLPALAAATALFWLWHLPPLYANAVANPLVYWLMQASLLGSAVWLWHGLLFVPSAMSAATTALGAATQMGLLGALLVFAPEPLYWPHFATTAGFGLTPLSDQHLAGLVMWVPANLPLLALVLWRLVQLLKADDTVAAR